MKLIIGLGNPEDKHLYTRHNAGFILIDEIQKKWSFPDFQFDKKFNAQVSEASKDNEKIILAKPQTFMNLSGQAVQAIMQFYKISTESLTVLHDDLDIELGKFKISIDSSAAGHNGVQSIFDSLGTQKIKRVRIGIEGSERKKDRTIAGNVFVLQDFTKEELEKINSMSQQVANNL
ncbi:MAG: Peptidyl-tRNA hydrolase [uncultured bacterium]|nr:MAG: Peptidyl-tRNA hydrolase [uncultured bacterium]